MRKRKETPIIATTRIGVIGDIHTDFDVLGWALSTLRAQGAELILATGDIADGVYGAEGVDRCCALLQEAEALTVCGNHDRWMLENEARNLPEATFLEEIGQSATEYLRHLPGTLELDTPIGKLLFGHGLGADDMATLYPHDHGAALTDNKVLQDILREDRYKFLVGGHTHRRMVRVIDELTVINAGALSRKREPCCVVLDFGERVAQFYDWTADQADGATKLGPTHTL